MDFVHDELTSGRKFRVLTVIDKWHRQCVALQADFALTGQSVVDALNAVACERDLPFAITVDHGTEFTSKVLDEVRAVLKAWRHDYNHCRPHGSLGNLTPSEYGSRRSEVDPEAPNSSFKWFDKRTNVSRGQALNPAATQKRGDVAAARRVEELGADEAAAHDKRGAHLVGQRRDLRDELIERFAAALVDVRGGAWIAPWSERWPRPCRNDAVAGTGLDLGSRGVGCGT
jgi:putative transposase